LKRIDRPTAELELRGARAAARGDTDELIECFSQQNIVWPPDRVPAEMVLEALLKTEGWFLQDRELAVTPELTNRIAGYATDLRGPVYRIFRGQPLPPAHMVQRRVEIQVLSILGQLRPVLNFHRIAREWLFGDPPATELGRLAAVWRSGGKGAAPALA
jgi:hypothetical protein